MSAKNINLFLDIDGVLHPDSADICRTLGLEDLELEDIRVAIVHGVIHTDELNLLCQERQELLARFLLDYPHVNIILSSAWRNWTGYNYMRYREPLDPAFELEFVETLDWLKQILHPVIANRLIGKTSVGPHRLLEVRKFERTFSKNTEPLRWIAIDDQPRNFPDADISPFYSEYALPEQTSVARTPTEMLMLVDGEKGLSTASIAALYRAAALITSYDQTRDLECCHS